MSSGGSARSISIFLGVTIVATLSVGSAAAVRRSGASQVESTGNSGQARMGAAAAFSGAAAEEGALPIPSLDPDADAGADAGAGGSPSPSPGGSTSTAPGPESGADTTVTRPGDTPTTTIPAGVQAQRPGLSVMRPDGSDATFLTTHTGWFSWSPGGASLVVARGGRLLVVAADGSGERTLSGAGSGVRWPMWSPDGTRIAYSSDALYTVAADGSGPPTMVSVDAIYSSWTPDSRLSTVTGDGRLVVFEPGAPRVLATGAFGAVAPAWSPDGSRVAYLGNRIMVVDADGSGARPVTDMCCGSEHSGSPLTWSPDGQRIAYIDQGDVRVVDVDSGAVTVVAAGASNPSWSPGGGQLAVVDQSFARPDGFLNNEVAVVDADGSGRHIVLTLPPSLAANTVFWSASGSRLAVSTSPRTGFPSIPG